MMGNEYKEWLKDQTFDTLAKDNLRIKLELQTAKEEINRLKDVCDNCGYDVDLKTLSSENALLIEENNNLKEQRRILKGTIKKFNLDWYGEELDTITQQNKQMREVMENVKFEAEFNGNDESLQKIINIVDNTLKEGE